MASLVTMQIGGLTELYAALKQLPTNIGKNVLRGAVAAGARQIRDAVIERAPVYQGDDPRVKAGTLKNAVYMKQINELSSEIQQVYLVGIRRGRSEQAKGRDAYFWTWVEFGHHVRPSSVNRRQHTGASLVTNASYVLPHPFFRPAFESTKDAAAQAIREYLAKRIPEEANKLGPR
jgi:HK97 gp10 family phage protein